MFLKNIPLKGYSSFKIGGPAKFFFEAENLNQLIKILKEARKSCLPVFVFGGGTKLLINDEGFDGLAIKMKNSKLEVKKNKIISEAGVDLGRLVTAAEKNGLAGLEWSIGIPGTVGGAIHGNSGAFGSSMSEITENVVVLDFNTLKIKRYSNKQCRFGYRESIFKHNQDIILSVELRLRKGKTEDSRKLMKGYLARRRERITTDPSAGSVFKNIKFDDLNGRIQKLIPKEKIKGGMVPAGYLIEECELKGRRIGGARISERQSNIIVNFCEAKAKDVYALIDLIKKQVKKKFGIKLEEEVIYLGQNR